MIKNTKKVKKVKKVKKLSKKQEKQAKIAEYKKQYLKNKRAPKRLAIHWNVIYHININFLRSNLFMNLHELNGQNIWWTSSGAAGFKGRQKNKHDGVLGHIIKFMKRISFIGKIYPFAIWKGMPKNRGRSVLKALRYIHKHFPPVNWLGSIANLYVPFNGCRRRKQKRR